MGRIRVDPAMFRERVGIECLGFEHEVHREPMFDVEALRRLASRYAPSDYFVAPGAQAPGQGFYGDTASSLSAADAIGRLSNASLRVLLKRPERHDAGFRKLLDNLMSELKILWPALAADPVVRLESFVFISSAQTLTPFHFDPEMGFFFQIAGPKTYHLYSSSVVRAEELERHYADGVIDIGQVPFEGRDPARENVFALAPGLGLHQPMNSPHWVETGPTLSISYSFAIETESTRAHAAVRAFNNYSRRLGLAPLPPGRPVRDALKVASMKVVQPSLRVLRKARQAMGAHARAGA